MPINNTSPLNNTGVTDIPQYQSWESSEINIYKSINITGDVAPFTQNINVKDVIGVYPQYTDFRLKFFKSYIPQNNLPFVQPFAYVDGGSELSSGYIPITQNGMTLEYSFTPQNVNLLALGSYKYRQILIIEGLNLQGLYLEISRITHDTILNIVADLVFYNPKILNFSHTIGTTYPTKEVVLNGNSWKFAGNPKFTLSSIDPGVTIVPLGSTDGDLQNAVGSGEGTVKITLNSFFDIPPVGLQLPYSTHLLKVFSGIELVGNVTVKVKKFTTQICTLSPDQLNFYAQKNIFDAAPQNLLFECNVAYVIEASPWLTTSVETISIDGNPTQVILVQPISNSNMDAGTYTGFVKVTATVNGVEVIKTAVIIYEIVDMAQFPYSNIDLCFSLDNKFINLQTSNSNTYMQMTMFVKAFDFYTDAVNEFEINEKIGLFKGKARVNISKTIHQILSKQREINENILQYKPAIVKIAFEELTLDTNSAIRGDSSGDLQFIAGLSNNFSKFGFLKFNHLPERVTVNSFKYLNFFIPLGMHKLLTYKNGILSSEEELILSEGKIMTLKVTFEEFNQGDKIEYSIINEEEIECSKIAYIIFPEGMYSNAIIWEDEFLLKQTIECTGIFNVKSTLDFISQKTYTNLVEQLSHLDITKVSKIQINTGWLMASDVDAVESLMKSKKVWINANDTTIFMVPISETIISKDSERELVDYTLEFQINPNYNEETYSL